MALVAVTFDGTRVNQAQAYTNWGNYGGSGAGGAAEAPIAYQNGLACNRKQTITTGLGGIDYDPAAGAVDMTGSTRRLWFCKVIVSDSFDLNTSEGLRVTIGSSSANTRKYNLAGSTATNDAYLAYPAQGGYILTAIDPTIAFWAITSTGTIATTAIDYFGVQGRWLTGQAKAENIAMDSIDIGTGLYLVGGTSTDPDAKFTDYVAVDQDISSNRWGCVSGSGNTVNAWAELRAGGAIEFFDETSVVNFKDGYHSAGLTRVLHELDTAGSTWTMGALLIGEGGLYNSGAIDTRPDYIITGTTLTGNYNLTGTLRNFRNITLTSAVDADGADIECQLLTQASAEIQNSTIRTNALTSVACLQDATFGTTTGLHDTTFVQAGAGHAIQISSGGTYNFENLFFSGYGADGTDSAALDVTTTASVTINVNGTTGNTPTFKTAGTGNVTIVAGAVTVQATAVQGDGTPVQTARVLLKASDDTGAFPYREQVTITRSGSTASVAHTAHGMANGDKVQIVGTAEREYRGIFTISNVTTNAYDYTVTGTPATPSVPETENLLTRSEEIDNASWLKTNCTITANNGVAPDGTTTADKVIPTVTSAASNVRQSEPVTTLLDYTHSFYAKSAGYDWVQVAWQGAEMSNLEWQNINLSDGSLGNGSLSTHTVKVKKIADATGWYRIEVTAPCVNTGANGRCIMSVYSTDVSSRLASEAGNATDGILIWGCMFEQKSEASKYIQTVATNQTSTRSTFVALEGVTDVNGELSTSRVYNTAQPVVGWTRKSSGSPYLKEGILTGSISTTSGFNGTAVMVSDE